MSHDLFLPPALTLLIGGVLILVAPPRWRSRLFSIFTLLALWQVWNLPEGKDFTFNLAGFQMSLVVVDRISRLFAIIFTLITFIGGLYSFHIQDRKELVSALFYAAGSLGVTLAGDYFTLFIFWESMAISSTYLVWASGNKESYKAGIRYLLIHLLGGGLLLAGIQLHVSSGGTLAIGLLTDSSSLSSWLILSGVLLNAAAPPLHAWLPDAYPNASVGGAIFLSALTTKSAVYVLVRIFAGWKVLLVIGVMMALYGVIYALLANDIRRILAYHIISQVGYMIAGVGIGTEMALNGTIAHAFSHILYKALLFMGAGSVLYSTNKSKLTELGGLARSMPLVTMLYLVGGFSISGFPLFNGFISKSLVVAAAGKLHMQTVVLLLQLAAIGTFLSTCLKLPYFTWFNRKQDIPVSPIPGNMYIGMGVTAFLCLFFGVLPGLLYNMLPFPVTFKPYSASHLVESMQLLVFTFLCFWVFRKKFAGKPKIALDLDWIYRRPASALRHMLVEGVSLGFAAVETISLKGVAAIAMFAKNPLRVFTRKGESGYSPDIYRLKLEWMISISILVFIVFAILGIVLVL